MNNPRYLHTEEKQEEETFFDVMNRLIARSKAVTADIDHSTLIGVLNRKNQGCSFSEPDSYVSESRLYGRLEFP